MHNIIANVGCAVIGMIRLITLQANVENLGKRSIKLGTTVGEGGPQGIVIETEIWPYYQVVHTQTRVSPKQWDT